MSAIKQFDIIKRSYFTGGELIPIDELESPIGLRVEGGGYIFYDDTVGFPGSKINIAKNALADRWGVDHSYGTYKYDMLRGCVVRESAGTCNRFMVVDETDMEFLPRRPKGSTAGNAITYTSTVLAPLMWDIDDDKKTIRDTSEAFGYGSTNTTLLCDVITSFYTIWGNIQHFRRNRNPQGSPYTSDSATDTKWFVPSKDEIYVLSSMATYDSAYRPTTGIYKRQLQLSFSTVYWTSSQYLSSSTSSYESLVYVLNFQYGSLSYEYKIYESSSGWYVPYTRLCRTF
jgi:hypothetical protein